MKEEELLSWLVHQKRHSEIPDISDEIMEKLIDKVEYLAVLFCKFFNEKMVALFILSTHLHFEQLVDLIFQLSRILNNDNILKYKNQTEKHTHN
jgi:hypothetical protein